MRTYADVLRREGFKQGLREAVVNTHQRYLVRLLRVRFGRVPRAVEEVIRATSDVACLNAWFVAAATAQSLAEVGISPAPAKQNGGRGRPPRPGD